MRALEKVANTSTKVISLLSCHAAVISALEHVAAQLVLIFCTLIAIFLLDVVQLVGTKDDDLWAQALVFVTLVIFAFELAIRCALQDQYFLSFAFFFDLLGTMVPNLLFSVLQT